MFVCCNQGLITAVVQISPERHRGHRVTWCRCERCSGVQKNPAGWAGAVSHVVVVNCAKGRELAAAELAPVSTSTSTGCVFVKFERPAWGPLTPHSPPAASERRGASGCFYKLLLGPHSCLLVFSTVIFHHGITFVLCEAPLYKFVSDFSFLNENNKVQSFIVKTNVVW